MADAAHGCRLGDLLAVEGVVARPIVADPKILDRVVIRARLLSGGLLPADVDDGTLLVHVPSGSSDAAGYLSDLGRIGALPGSQVIATWPPAGVDERQMASAAGSHVLLAVGAELDPAGLISAVARTTQPADQALTSRLTALQRAMTRALAEPQPLPALVTRLARTCNATAAVVRADGQLEAASGPIPLALLLGQLADGPGDSRPFAVQGWYGIGVRIVDEAGPAGWLLMASRRSSFPDQHAIAAVHVAASLVETNLRIDMLARRQDRAVRSSLLEQLLALRPQRHDPELEGRLAALGLSFSEEHRVLLVTLLPGQHSRHRTAELETMLRTLDRELGSDGVPHLLAAREHSVVGLAQVTAPTARRVFTRIGAGEQGFVLGVGRRIGDVGDVAASYHDALLAVRALRAPGRTATAMSYDEFDFATRLFSDVGLDRMAEWADEMLRPLTDQQILVEGLRLYFEHGMNIIAAAKALRIHHNSLRYRLGRAEELLNISLRDPAAVSSLFLALTATAMVGPPAVRRPEGAQRERTPGTALPTEAHQGVRIEPDGRLSTGLGVAIGPER